MTQRTIIRSTEILIAGAVKIDICSFMRVYKLNGFARNRMIACHISTAYLPACLPACVLGLTSILKALTFTVVILSFMSNCIVIFNGQTRYLTENAEEETAAERERARK